MPPKRPLDFLDHKSGCSKLFPDCLKLLSSRQGVISQQPCRLGHSPNISCTTHLFREGFSGFLSLLSKIPITEENRREQQPFLWDVTEKITRFWRASNIVSHDGEVPYTRPHCLITSRQKFTIKRRTSIRHDCLVSVSFYSIYRTEEPPDPTSSHSATGIWM